MKEKIKRLEELFNTFKIDGKVIGIKKGPSVISLEVAIKGKTKVNEIYHYKDEIALALGEEPLIQFQPKRQCIELQISRDDRQIVFFNDINKNILSSYELPIVLGKDMKNDDCVIDLIECPHLLVGGCTGSGKSIFLHSAINGIWWTKNAKDVRFLLIDPKAVEFSAYDKTRGTCVITDTQKAIFALENLISLMEDRFQILHYSKMRDLKEFRKTNKNIPFVVGIIDELADLIMTQKSIDKLICRLAQKGRAAGIHLILATQRPSVDVVTGLIKANFPTRIAFKVASSTDSRVILDSSEAASLIGKGDMLYRGLDSFDLKRVQGAFIKKETIELITKNINLYLNDLDYTDFDKVFFKKKEIEKKNINPFINILKDFLRSKKNFVFSLWSIIDELKETFNFIRSGNKIEDMKEAINILNKEGYITKEDSQHFRRQ